MTATDDRSTRRAYRIRIALFLACVGLTAFALDTLTRTVNTLRRLELVEAERDHWQRPTDVLAAMNLGAGKTAVDLGCGSGYFALKLARAVGERGLVVAIDIRSVPLLFLRLRALLEGRRNLLVALGRPDDPGLASGSVDAVLIANTFHELGDRRTVLGHLQRALRRRGRLVVVDPSPREAAEQALEAEHHLEPASVESELQDSGFEILVRQDRFLEQSNGTIWWLIVAQKQDLRRP